MMSLRDFLSFLLAKVIPLPYAIVAAGHAAGYVLKHAANVPQARLALLPPTWRGPLPTGMGGHRPSFDRLCQLVDLPGIGPALYKLNVNRVVVPLKSKNPACEAVRREYEEDWARRWSHPQLACPAWLSGRRSSRPRATTANPLRNRGLEYGAAAPACDLQQTPRQKLPKPKTPPHGERLRGCPSWTHIELCAMPRSQP
jgi:hypothetical protein